MPPAACAERSSSKTAPRAPCSVKPASSSSLRGFAPLRDKSLPTATSDQTLRLGPTHTHQHMVLRSPPNLRKNRNRATVQVALLLFEGDASCRPQP